MVLKLFWALRQGWLSLIRGSHDGNDSNGSVSAEGTTMEARHSNMGLTSTTLTIDIHRWFRRFISDFCPSPASGYHSHHHPRP